VRKSLKAKAQARIPEVDGLRGLAILLVIVWHYIKPVIPAYFPSFPPFVMSYVDLTWSGVDLFFVISGFLISGILLDNQSSPSYFKTFYARRIFRIFPLYYLTLAVFAVGALYYETFGPTGYKWVFDNRAPFLVYGLFLQNFWSMKYWTFGAGGFGVTWSMAVEEQFYLALPPLIRWFPRKHLPLLLLLLILVAGLVRKYFIEGVYGGFLTSLTSPVARMDSFAFGILGALAVRSEKAVRVFKQSKVLIAAIMGLILLYLPGLGPIGFGGIAVYGHLLLAIFYSLLLIQSVLNPGAYLSRLLRIPVLTKVGELSFGIYLLHELVSGLLHGALFGTPPQAASTWQAGLTIVLAAGITFGLAWGLSRFVERPMIVKGHRWKYGA